MSLSTHILNAVTGRPAPDVPVRLERAGAVLAEARTDADGRVRDLGTLTTGVHRLVFDSAAVFPDGFYPEVVVTFTVTDPDTHHHVPLLLSPFAYSTYRGS
ncbi:5-hydroxyisourate hydrolase [Pseudonocardia thermophila]|jgi:hydroxyisourate hydrolase|uniref:5-hydroxyisourate hydrolase n=1 Tax=Pseudonocardia thermophila TaxID=1848 RepID=A0A1M7AKC8_PSETH|nr:hydroxyisourate hydrolase [Pseudonocardia thermophila]SHL43188.1 5-hydroxyisourate hydrolase [Pseudonocardia thermophila]